MTDTYYYADSGHTLVPTNMFHEDDVIAVTYEYIHSKKYYIYKKVPAEIYDIRFIVIFRNPEEELRTYLKLLGITIKKVSDETFISALNRLYNVDYYQPVY